MLGKLAITCAWAGLYVFTSELYPTSVRNVGAAACTAFSNIGSTLAPQLSHLVSYLYEILNLHLLYRTKLTLQFKISTYLPLVILGSGAFIAGLLSLRLPETLNVKLLEIISDGEDLKQYVYTQSSQYYSNLNENSRVHLCFRNTKRTQQDIEQMEKFKGADKGDD